MAVNSRLIGAAGALTVVGALAFAVLTDHEGLRTRAYRDVVGVWTICIGDTKGVKPGDRDTVEGCKQRLARRLPDYEQPMRRCIKDPDALPDKTYVAVLSLFYNIGPSKGCSSSVVAEINAGHFAKACDKLLAYRMAGGRVWPGLVRRRQAERKLCLEGLKEKVITIQPEAWPPAKSVLNGEE